ncbi:MAG: hypothetical protein ACYC1C_13420 [Chloroflexota bacterium]
MKAASRPWPRLMAVLVACALLAGMPGCANSGAPAARQETANVNVVREAKLGLTTSIVVWENLAGQPEPTAAPTASVQPPPPAEGVGYRWAYLTKIDDAGLIAELLKALDREVAVQVGVGLA